MAADGKRDAPRGGHQPELLLDRVIKVQAVSDDPAVIARCEATIRAKAQDKGFGHAFANLLLRCHASGR